jgi:hypothetical protein
MVKNKRLSLQMSVIAHIIFTYYMNVLLRQDVLQHMFGLLSGDFKNMREYNKWGCVCKTWNLEQLQWGCMVMDIVDNFKMQYLPVITENRDIPAVMHVMTKYMWDYEIMIECLILLVEWTRDVEGSTFTEVDIGILIDGGDEVMEESGDEFESSDELMEEGGVEDVVVEIVQTTEPPTIEEQFEDVENELKAKQAINENIQLSNDQTKDDIYEVADIDNKLVAFESVVHIDSAVKLFEPGHVVDEGKRVVYNNMVIMIVEVMKKFQIVYDGLVDVKFQCLYCLANLAAFHQVRMEMGTGPFFHEMISTIQSISVNVDIGRGVNVLMAVCEGNDAAKKAFIDEDGFQFLAKLSLQCNKTKYIDFDICVMVLDLCKREGDVVCMQQVDSAVVEFLLESATKYVDSSRFMHNVSRTIQFIATNTSNKNEFVKGGGVQVMETVLAKYTENPAVREFTSAALDNMRST